MWKRILQFIVLFALVSFLVAVIRHYTTELTSIRVSGLLKYSVLQYIWIILSNVIIFLFLKKIIHIKPKSSASTKINLIYLIAYLLFGSIWYILFFFTLKVITGVSYAPNHFVFGYKIIYIIAIISLLAFLEEMIFRVYIFEYFQKHSKVLVAAIYSSLLFGITHEYPFNGIDFLFINFLLQFLKHFLFGLLLCNIYDTTKSIFAVTGIHIGWNLFAIQFFPLSSMFRYNDFVIGELNLYARTGLGDTYELFIPVMFLVVTILGFSRLKFRKFD